MARRTQNTCWNTSSGRSEAARMRVQALQLSMNHCQERGQPCPREPNFQDSRTRLSALLSVDGSSSQCMRKKRKRALHEPYTQLIGNERSDQKRFMASTHDPNFGGVLFP